MRVGERSVSDGRHWWAETGDAGHCATALAAAEELVGRVWELKSSTKGVTVDRMTVTMRRLALRRVSYAVASDGQ